MQAESIALAITVILLGLGSALWIGQSIHRRRRRDRGSSGAVPKYFEALTALLDERADRALELFLDLANRDSEAVELHFALGSLFRRKGEIERATLIHQNLIARPSLSTRQRDLALKELGQDYLRAGLYDRAERIFSELLDRKQYQDFAARQLVTIYEQQQDWLQAAALRRRLEWITGESQRAIIAHYHCELVECALEAGDSSAAFEALREARRYGPDVIRVRLLLAQRYTEEGEQRRAAKEYRYVLDQDTGFAEIVLPSFMGLYASGAHAPEFSEQVERMLNRGGPSAKLAIAVTGFKHPELRVPSVLHAVELVLSQRLDPLAADRSALLESHSVRVALITLMTRWVERRALYQCSVCGFAASALYWHCPGCHSWSTMNMRSDIFPDPDVASEARKSDGRSPITNPL